MRLRHVCLCHPPSQSVLVTLAFNLTSTVLQRRKQLFWARTFFFILLWFQLPLIYYSLWHFKIFFPFSFIQMRSFHQLTTTALLCHSWFDLCTLDTVLEIHSIILPVYVFFSNCFHSFLKAKINSWKSLFKVLLYTFDLFLTIENCEFLLLRSIINIWKKYFDARFLRIFKHCATPSFFGVCAFNAIFDMCWLDCNEHVRWWFSNTVRSYTHT